MLGLTEARKIYNDNPQDPYVILMGANIEVRFGDDGSIVAAYYINTEEQPVARRWVSAEQEALNKSFRRVDELPRKEEPVAQVNTPPQLAGTRKAAGIRKVAPRGIGRPVLRREDW